MELQLSWDPVQRGERDRDREEVDDRRAGFERRRPSMIPMFESSLCTQPWTEIPQPKESSQFENTSHFRSMLLPPSFPAQHLCRVPIPICPRVSGYPVWRERLRPHLPRSQPPQPPTLASQGKGQAQNGFPLIVGCLCSLESQDFVCGAVGWLGPWCWSFLKKATMFSGEGTPALGSKWEKRGR